LMLFHFIICCDMFIFADDATLAMQYDFSIEAESRLNKDLNTNTLTPSGR
jgi:hypothetical protein